MDIWRKELIRLRQLGDANSVLEGAAEAVKWGESNSGHWDAGNAVHWGHIAIGFVHLERGDVDMAADHLLEAGKCEGSPQLDTFGPDLELANRLIEANRHSVVVEYLRLCSTFWHTRTRVVEKWISALARGKTFELRPF